MGFKDVTVRESKGVLIVDAVEETVVTNNIVATEAQLLQAIADLDVQRDKYQLLIDAIKAAPPATPVDPVPVTP